MYFVYVLLSKNDNQFYVGFSANVEKRLSEHNAGENQSTVSRRPLILLYYEAHLSKEDALRRENYFKTTKGKSTFRQMIRISLTDQLTARATETAPIH